MLMSKLNWFNESHLKKLANEQISKLIPTLRSFMESKYGNTLESRFYGDAYLAQVISTIKVTFMYWECSIFRKELQHYEIFQIEMFISSNIPL